MVLYTVLIIFFVFKRQNYRKLMMTSLLICASSAVAVIPHVLLSINFQMSYKVAQITTITLYYTTPLCDSAIYYFANPKIQREIPQTPIARAGRMVSKQVMMGVQNLVTRTVLRA